MDRALRVPEVLLKNIEGTDLKTALTLRLMRKWFCHTTDLHAPSICKSVAGSTLEQGAVSAVSDEGVASPIKCLAPAFRRDVTQRVASNSFDRRRGIPPDEPWGDELRKRAANGFMIAFQHPDFARRSTKNGEPKSATKKDVLTIWAGKRRKLEKEVRAILDSWQKYDMLLSANERLDHEIAWSCLKAKICQKGSIRTSDAPSGLRFLSPDIVGTKAGPYD